MNTSWEVVAEDGIPHGIAVDAREVSLWSGRPPADSGTSITHAKFLKGEYQGQVAERFGCGVLLEAIAAVHSFHPAAPGPNRTRMDRNEVRQVLAAAIREGHVAMLSALVQEGIDLNPHDPYDYWPLWEACRARSPQRVEAVRVLLEGGADPNLTIQEADNVLLGVIDHFPDPEADLAPIATLLLDHGLKLEARDSIQRTALIAACAHGMVELVAVLLARGADVQVTTGSSFQETPLQAAMQGDSRVQRGRHQEVIELLMRHGADPSARIPDDRGLLRHAAEHGYLTIARQLLEEGADVDLAEGKGPTALMRAAREGQAETAKVLLEHGAAVDRKQYDGQDALLLAAAGGHAEMVSILPDRGADVQARDRDGNTALLQAAHGGHVDVMGRLLARGADVNERNDRGRSALMQACEKSGADVVRWLLSRGADVNAADGEQRTALDRLAQGLFLASGRKETRAVAEALLAAGADPNRRDAWGCTPAAIAAIVGDADLLERLLDHGADANAADELGVTPLMQAVLYGHPAIARLLEGAGAAPAAASGRICPYAECPICRQLPDHAFADENRGEYLPPAAARLVRVRSQCPYCGSRYELEDTADNSEHYPVLHLRRVSQGDQGRSTPRDVDAPGGGR